MRFCLLLIFGLVYVTFQAQEYWIGKIQFSDSNTQMCTIGIQNASLSIQSDEKGNFKVPKNKVSAEDILRVYAIDYHSFEQKISAIPMRNDTLLIQLTRPIKNLSMVEVYHFQQTSFRLETTQATELFSRQHFDKNVSTSLLDAMDRINGVRQQVNCNVCGTGDIHINGLEGPYTLVVLDGIPLIGGLSSVYGLSGIPSFLLEKIEVTKGPGSSLYGSESIGGVIHAYTRKATKKPEFFVQLYGNSHVESNLDLGVNTLIGKKISVFSAGNYYQSSLKIDQNEDNFTDIPLQHRFSGYQRWKIERKADRIFTISGRILSENRWGGELDWENRWKGSDSIYGESIKTHRQELNVAYQFPLKEKIMLQSHVSNHFQDSYYGQMHYRASQKVAFNQLVWEKNTIRHAIQTGATLRYLNYNDNTPVTANPIDSLQDQAEITFLPGIFFEDDYTLRLNQKIGFSARLDHHTIHGFIPTVRLGYWSKWRNKHTVKANFGTGFRVVNLFSEDHAALSGARKVVITETLNPEQSLSFQASYSGNWYRNKQLFTVSISPFYTHFYNRIIADYESNPSEIQFGNSKESGRSAGVSLDFAYQVAQKINMQLGATWMDVSLLENGIRTQQILTERFSGNWTISVPLNRWKTTIDYTGNVIGKMRLPILNATDPRPENSRMYSIQNIQITYSKSSNVQFFVGVKNLLNWTPARGIPFLIARANDPFDKEVLSDPSGNPIASPNNPNALTFDPSYVYAPNQGIRFLLGFRLKIGG
jgi:outer membrane receptor for ferrienterochelin and colicins